MKRAIGIMAMVAVFVAASMSAQAGEIYKWRDASGVLHYGNRPAPGSQAIGSEIEFDAEAHAKRIECDRLQQQVFRLEDKVDALREATSRPRIVVVPQAHAPVVLSSSRVNVGSGDYSYRRPHRRPVIVVPPRREPRAPYYQRHKGPSAAEINGRLR